MAETSTKPGLDIRRYAGQVIDSYESNKRHMEPEVARSRTISAHAAHAAEMGRASRDGAAKVAHSAIATYEVRIEEGYPAGRARVDAARVAAGWYNGQGEPRQPHGTLDVKAFTARVIDQYVADADLRGRTAARQSTVYAVSGTAEANGVNGTRAARVADASINEYERLSAKGAPHDLARAGAIRRTAERYDQHAHDRQRRQGRDRGGMSL